MYAMTHLNLYKPYRLTKLDYVEVLISEIPSGNWEWFVDSFDSLLVSPFITLKSGAW